MKKTLTLLTIALAIILILNLASAVVINVAETATISPGSEGRISIEIENTLQEDITDVSLILNFQNLPFIPVGSSEASVEEIEEDQEEDFSFTIKASNEIAPGDYAIPYTLTYEVNNQVKTRTGTLGVKIKADPELTYSISTENPVLNQKGTITLNIINKGFFDARFVSLKIVPTGMTLLSEDQIYIGTVDSDDFETVTFDVLFKSENPTLSGLIEYKDFENQPKIEGISLPVKVYSEEEAIELGIMKKSNLAFYIIIIVALILIWVVWRVWKRRSRMKKSMNGDKNK